MNKRRVKTETKGSASHSIDGADSIWPGGRLMSEEEKTPSWSFKDGLVIIPFFASGLALTWEVGFFLRIKGGAFGLFSVSEHITFALQALPAALALAALIIVGSNYTTILDVYGSVTGLSARQPVLYAKLKRFFWPLFFLTVIAILALARFE